MLHHLLVNSNFPKRWKLHQKNSRWNGCILKSTWNKNWKLLIVFFTISLFIVILLVQKSFFNEKDVCIIHYCKCWLLCSWDQEYVDCTPSPGGGVFISPPLQEKKWYPEYDTHLVVRLKFLNLGVGVSC